MSFSLSSDYLDTDQTRLFGMLQVEAVAFGDLAVDSLLDPDDLVDELVAPVAHHLAGHGVLRIDDPVHSSVPHKEEACLLKSSDRQSRDQVVCQGRVTNRDASGRLRRRELPRRIHHDNVEKPASVLHLRLDEPVEVELGDISVDRHRLEWSVADSFSSIGGYSCSCLFLRGRLS